MKETAARLPRLLSAIQVSSQTGIPRQRLYELVRADAIPHVRIGRSIRFESVRLHLWIESGGTNTDITIREAQ
jgi:excisionase family DNA binding protein